MFRLDGKTALVTGGSKGIGFGLAQGLAEAGADLVLVARGRADLETAREKLAETGRRIEIATCDLLQTDKIDGFYQELITDIGSIDILINNAGMTVRAPAHELEMADLQKILALNVTSVFAMSQAFARERIAAGQPGKIVNIGSLMCSATRPGTSAYTTSKGGVLLMTKALATDWASHGILVNAIGPGYIETPLTKPLVDDPEFTGWVQERTPLARWGTPADLVGAAVFLASPAADFITGQIIYVDGGWLARF